MNTEEALRDYILELERENRSLKIWLDQYVADATALIEEHGCDPSDKIDREDLKRMLNYLIGENRRLKNGGTNWGEAEERCNKLEEALKLTIDRWRLIGRNIWDSKVKVSILELERQLEVDVEEILKG